MFRTALRNVLAHKARLLMTVLAVMLGVAFVSGTLVFTNTISDAYQKSSAKGFDQVDVAIQPESQADKGDTVGKVQKLTQPLLDKAVLEDRTVYPDAETMKSLYIITAHDQKTQRLMNRLWTKIKTGR